MVCDDEEFGLKWAAMGGAMLNPSRLRLQASLLDRQGSQSATPGEWSQSNPALNASGFILGTLFYYQQDCTWPAVSCATMAFPIHTATVAVHNDVQKSQCRAMKSPCLHLRRPDPVTRTHRTGKALIAILQGVMLRAKVIYIIT